MEREGKGGESEKMRTGEASEISFKSWRSGAAEGLLLGEGLSAGRGEVSQIIPDRKLSSMLQSENPEREPFEDSLPPNQTIHFPLTAHHSQ